jgi:hypothetical protein
MLQDNNKKILKSMKSLRTTDDQEGEINYIKHNEQSFTIAYLDTKE